MAYMIYEDYRKSALKHLKTCEYMIGSLENLSNIENYKKIGNKEKEKYENNILRETYYLLGYVLEGIVNYCILKKLPSFQSDNDKNVYGLDEQIVSSILSQDYQAINTNISFSKKDTSMFYLGKHEYTKNIQLLKMISPQKFQLIDIINSDRDPNDYISVMYYDWNVYVRYQTKGSKCNFDGNLSYDKEKITKFFDFVNNIFSKLPTL